MVRVGGSESCFRLTPFQVVPREETAGLVIVESISQIECVPNNRSYPGIRCGTQTCPICPTNCCFTHIYPKECPDFHRVPQENPKSNICCSWGRDYTIIISYQTRLLEEAFGYLGQPTSRRLEEYSGREVMRRLVCGENAEATPDDIRCIEAQHYRRNDFESFVDPNLNTSFEDRTDRCLTQAYPVKQTPIVYGPGNTIVWPSVIVFPSRPGFKRLQNENGTVFTEIAFDASGAPGFDPLCRELDNFVSTQQLTGDRDVEMEAIVRTTFRYGLVCLQGNILFDQVQEIVQRSTNILLARYTFRHEASFSVRVNSSTHCPPNVCDGYAQTGNVISLPGLPPQPIQGALSLL